MTVADPALAAALDSVAAVADAVLFEGYLLYPYRASAQKNRLRWQFGVLTPPADDGEPSSSHTECLLEPRHGRPALHVRVRFLQVRDRRLRDAGGAPVEELTVAGVRHLSWEEGVPRQVDVEVSADELLDGVTRPFTLPAETTTEPLGAGAMIRTCDELTGVVRVRAATTPGPYDVLRLRIDVENTSACPDGAAPRDVLLRSSLIAAHTVVAVTGGAFLSMTDPPQWARPFAQECENTGTWPVLAGPQGRDDLLLSSPIILADHPQLAPESTIDLFDGTENDEILTLRTMALTDAEKAEARATDPRAASIIDAVDALPPEILERLHGAIRSMGPAVGEEPDIPTFTTPIGADSPDARPPDRLPWWDPAADDTVDPETDSVLVDGAAVAKGSAVVLRPGRGSDAQDAFLAGMRATVHAVVHDVDGAVHVAVSVDDDPAADLQLAHGRFRYFRPEELEVPS
ncbi:MAG: hypothetical protein L0H84_00060 [Pseudonocardia sp.]|nr:hypothetical protein [Pseudonocardia sp.]